MNIIIAVRDNINWQQMTEEKFLMQNNKDTLPAKKALKYFDKIIKPWNDTLPISFFDYRNQMRQIASSTWHNVKGATILYGNQLKMHNLSNHLICPVDDDDWFLPELSEINFGHDIDVVHWIQGRIRLANKKSHYKYSQNSLDTYFTNNYGFTDNAYYKLDDLNYLLHMKMNRRLKDFKSIKIAQVFGIHINHVGSLSSFNKNKTLDDIVFSIRCVANNIKNITLPTMAEPLLQLEKLYGSF